MFTSYQKGVFASIILIAVMVSGILLAQNKNVLSKQVLSFLGVTKAPIETVVCTQEARLCADGSYVGRSGPRCDFELCPTVTQLSTTTMPSSTQTQSTTTSTASPKPVIVPPEVVACTKDAKICPDGTAVGRTGPRCEFVECPIPKTTGEITVRGSVTMGPTCPVERMPPDPACAEKPYVGTIRLSKQKSTITYNVTTDKTGAFTLNAAPGTYDISRDMTVGPFPSCAGEIEIVDSKTLVAISCDTGIR